VKTVIIKYNAGNILSVTHALRRLGVEPLVSDDPDEIRAAGKVIFPGVGAASSAMAYLRERGLDRVIKGLSQPVLGVCLGLQLMCSWSEEGQAECLGIFPQKVRRFPPLAKVPHMGWNSLSRLSGPLFEGLSPEPYVYFVHSYFAECSSDTAAAADYILTFSAALQRENFFALQFHPEKSGARILSNFLAL
jgi:imidazole glycerol-phosphate synthase subunit HisH